MNIKVEIIIIVFLSVFIIMYSTDISKKYPEKIIELMNENISILLFIGIIYYLLSLKKYTIAILVSIIFTFLLMDISILTEHFIDNIDISGKQKELLDEIQKLNNSDITDTLQGGTSTEEISNNINDINKLLGELEQNKNDI